MYRVTLFDSEVGFGIPEINLRLTVPPPKKEQREL